MIFRKYLYKIDGPPYLDVWYTVWTVVQRGDWLKIRSLCDQKLKARSDLYYKCTSIHSIVKVFLFVLGKMKCQAVLALLI